MHLKSAFPPGLWTLVLTFGLVMAVGMSMLPASAAAAETVPPVTRISFPAVPVPATAASQPLPPHASALTTPSPRHSAPAVRAAPTPGEFERLATEANGGVPIRRFGHVLRGGDAVRPSETPGRVPPGYVLQVGDEVSVTLWGSVDADWRVRIDRAGRAALPRVGPVPLAGSTAAELDGRVRARLERVFRGFEASFAVTDISPMRVHLTGFVEQPGEIVVPGLTTISQALALAQGPSAGGSWRRIRLIRDERTEAVFDFYALLAAGSKRDDLLLQPGDVLHVEAAGPQVALLGSVNRPAIFEFLPGDSVADVLRMAGGMSTVAARDRLQLERMGNRFSVGAVQLALPKDGSMLLADGDVLRAVSLVDTALPTMGRNKRVRVDGEVVRPGDYLLPPQATLADALAAAGGATAQAFLFGSELRRENVRLVQEQNFERALQQAEAEIARTASARAGRDGAAASDTAAQQQLARLRTRKPEGRMVLDLTPDASTLPPLPLEDLDQLHVPGRSQSVGVYGSVFNVGNFVHDGSRRLSDYLQRAGGPTAAADYRGVFVVRANGTVLSARQAGWWSGTDRLEAEPALPGDTVFVPELSDRTTWLQAAKDWTQVLYQFGLGVAGLRALR